MTIGESAFFLFSVEDDLLQGFPGFVVVAKMFPRFVSLTQQSVLSFFISDNIISLHFL